MAELQLAGRFSLFLRLVHAERCLGIIRWLSLCEIVLKHRNLRRTECSAHVSDAKVGFGDCWVLLTISPVSLGRDVLSPLKVQVLKLFSGLFFFIFQQGIEGEIPYVTSDYNYSIVGSGKLRKKKQHLKRRPFPYECDYT